MDGPSRSKHNCYAKLRTDLSDHLTDSFCVGEHYQWRFASPFQCLGSLHTPLRRKRGEADEGTGITILLQGLSEVTLLCAGNAPRSVRQTPDQPSLG